METTKTSNFTYQSKSFISIFFNCQVSACELQPFSCHNLANDLYSETAKTVFSHLQLGLFWVQCFLVFSVKNPKHRFTSHTLLNLNLHFEEFYDSDQFTWWFPSHLFLKLKYNFENLPSRMSAQIRLYLQLITSCITRHVAVVAVDKIAHVRRVANRLWCVKFLKINSHITELCEITKRKTVNITGKIK